MVTHTNMDYRFIPVIGFKIRDIVEGIDTEYSRAWAWRDMQTQDTKLDGLRADALLQRLILCEENNADCRMCHVDEFKASFDHVSAAKI